MLEILKEKKAAEIDGKKFDYDSYYVVVDFGYPIGKYPINLKIETKAEKQLLSQLLPFAKFDLVKKESNGKAYVRPVIDIKTDGVDITIVPKMLPDTLTLIRLALQV